MSHILIRGGNRLQGTVKVSGAKNAVLPLVAASLLASEGTSCIEEAPPLNDVFAMCALLRALGADVQHRNTTLTIQADTIDCYEAPAVWVKQLRASFLVMGPLLARFGHALIPLPGGCAIGTRPIDQHLKGLQRMGAQLDFGHGCIRASVANQRLVGARMYLDVASVGATQNLMMAATLATGTTVIDNVAKEPEIVDLANFLNAMGANVRGAGTDTLRIEGVEQLRGATHTVIPDRIEAGTFMIAAAMTNGDLYIEGAIADHLTSVMAKLEEMGVSMHCDDGGIHVRSSRDLRGIDIKTLPYPGFPTDLQAPMMALMLVSQGHSMVTETVFENRFQHVASLRQMHARIAVQDGRTAIVEGDASLQAAHVEATDLRAAAALLLAALAAQGETTLTGLHHLDRGYDDIVGKLRLLGADVQRMPDAVASPIVQPRARFDVVPSLA